MVDVLPSYVQGSWHTATGDGTPVVDASTGEAIAAVSSLGIDFAATVDYARSVGGPSLRRLGFRDRVGLVQRLALHLKEHKQPLYELSRRAGSTRPDIAFDVDGGIGALFVLAKKGKADLPDGNFLLDGDFEVVSKQGSFVGQHVWVPRRGVAIHINAFNFPVWSLLGKLAPALIAGVPVIAKPATPTAFIAQALVATIVESGILPDGALQMIAGSTGDLLDQLSGQDMIAFTGSAATARTLRAHPRIFGQTVRFNSEADSLNSIVLGSDVTAGSAEFDLFVTEIVHEMTQKAGQKCTAIRRAFVPQALASTVLDALGEKLAAVRVGNPASAGVTMGPLVSVEQRDAVRADVERLASGAKIVFGNPYAVEVTDGDAEVGAFMSPILLWAEDTSRSELHEIEAFGPVCTVMPYGSTEEAAELAARGGGSLVTTVVSHDPAVVQDLVFGLAPYHGRLHVLDRSCAKESTGHGAVLPHLVHGGPGRAGGGEELGGLRSLRRYFQRTALQGSPDMLTAVTNRWISGATRNISDTHPFRKHLEDLRLGDALVSEQRAVTLDDIERFADLTGDIFYAHMDAEAAAANPFFEGRVAHGYLVVAIAAGLFVDPAPGPVLANYGIDRLRFVTPVNPGDALRVTLTAKEIRPRRTYGEVVWDAVVVNQNDVTVAEYDVLTMVAKRSAE